jgi:Icc-related predicted phosphoesterase
LNATKGKTTIILSHTPPYEILDLGIRFADPKDGADHIGSKALKDLGRKEKACY